MGHWSRSYSFTMNFWESPPDCLEEGGLASEIQLVMVGMSFGPGQNASLMILALPHLLWASQGTSLSLKFLICKAGMMLMSPTWGYWEEQM